VHWVLRLAGAYRVTGLRPPMDLEPGWWAISRASHTATSIQGCYDRCVVRELDGTQSSVERAGEDVPRHVTS
jgi:hypothetical protein